MSAALSASVKKRYGVARVCRVWETPRSTLYHRREISRRERPPQRPGPKPAHSDQEIADRIRAQHAELEQEYGIRGEGYRKAWARLRHAGVRIGKARVLRIMREHGLLAPARAGRYHGPKVHDGTMYSDGPESS